MSPTEMPKRKIVTSSSNPDLNDIQEGTGLQNEKYWGGEKEKKRKNNKKKKLLIR